MTFPYALLRVGFPYLTTLACKRITDFPMDLAIGKDGLIYVLCTAPIRVITFDEQVVRTFGKLAWGRDRKGVGEDEMMWPIQVVLDGEDNLYITDEACHRITMYSKEGQFLGHWGQHGSKEGQLNRPAGIAFDAKEDVFVVDALNHRVQKFTKDGRFIMSFGSQGNRPGEFDTPWGIAEDKFGDLYVSDWRNDRVQKFTCDGRFIFEFGKSGTGDGELTRPAGIEVDDDGDIYVADWGNNRVNLYNKGGRFVQKFIGDATLSKSAIQLIKNQKRVLRLREMANMETEKRFQGPRSVRLDKKGRMYVADHESYRIQVYQKQAVPLTQEEIGPELKAPSLSAN
ncbi:MAG: 6-bladed beta-propeller [SAR202 cluster bacterium]|nr:6-bladed beta-propeller [SAR202 cluster bacterium]